MSASGQAACAIVEHCDRQRHDAARLNLPTALGQRHDQHVILAIGNAGCVVDVSDIHVIGGCAINVPDLPVIEFSRKPLHERLGFGGRWCMFFWRGQGARHFVVVHVR